MATESNPNRPPGSPLKLLVSGIVMTICGVVISFVLFNLALDPTGSPPPWVGMVGLVGLLIGCFGVIASLVAIVQYAIRRGR